MKKFQINFLAISGDSKHFSFFPEKNPPKKSTSRRAGGNYKSCLVLQFNKGMFSED
jgi:hypothetical protein